MKTRIGKIARIPHHLREELNQRLANGEIGKNLLAWLNALPEVQKIMAELFGGRQITHQNLSEWRHGAYAEWAGSRMGQTQCRNFLEYVENLNQRRTGENAADMPGYLGTLVLIELNEALNQLHDTENSDERWKILRMISRTLSRLRMDDCREKRVRLWDAKAARRNGQSKAIPTDANLKKIIS